MEFSRQEYRNGLPFPLPEGLPDPGIKPASPVSSALKADSLPLSHRKSPTKPHMLPDFVLTQTCKMQPAFSAQAVSFSTHRHTHTHDLLCVYILTTRCPSSTCKMASFPGFCQLRAVASTFFTGGLSSIWERALILVKCPSFAQRPFWRTRQALGIVFVIRILSSSH